MNTAAADLALFFCLTSVNRNCFFTPSMANLYEGLVS